MDHSEGNVMVSWAHERSSSAGAAICSCPNTNPKLDRASVSPGAADFPHRVKRAA